MKLGITNAVDVMLLIFILVWAWYLVTFVTNGIKGTIISHKEHKVKDYYYNYEFHDTRLKYSVNGVIMTTDSVHNIFNHIDPSITIDFLLKIDGEQNLRKYLLDAIWEYSGAVNASSIANIDFFIEGIKLIKQHK